MIFENRTKWCINEGDVPFLSLLKNCTFTSINWVHVIPMFSGLLTKSLDLRGYYSLGNLTQHSRSGMATATRVVYDLQIVIDLSLFLICSMFLLDE